MEQLVSHCFIWQRYKRQLRIGGPGGANGLTCLTGSGRVVMGNESALFTMEILDEEPDAPVGSEEAVASSIGQALEIPRV